MTKISVGDWESEFHLVIPAYFRGEYFDFINKLSKNGFKLSSYDQEHFQAELIYRIHKNAQPIRIHISYNNRIKHYLGPNALEITVKGELSLEHVDHARETIEGLFKDLIIEEMKFIDFNHGFVVPEVSFPSMHEVKSFYERRRKERDVFIQQWQDSFKSGSYDKPIAYEKQSGDRK